MAKQVSSQGLEQFQDRRFGMFIHWGLYAILGRGEWIMHVERISPTDYRPLAQKFNPVRFNADQWVNIAADAGQKYMVITSRHHDGFSMYDTALSDYKVTNTPFGRDPLDELANACARRGDVKLGFYSSLLDWQHPAYRYRTESGLAWADYIDFLHGQVRELCTNFGEIACMWFDGDWPAFPLDENSAYFQAGGSFEYEKLYDMIHTLQPDAIVLNNRHVEPLPGEDIQGFEQDLPGMNTSGFNIAQISAKPLEVGMTINGSWGYHRTDQNHKSARHLVHLLARSASAGANLLLNVGPTAEGEILPIHAHRLHEVGLWLQKQGSSIYGTRAGIIPPTPEAVSTTGNGAHYIHVLHYLSDSISLEQIPDHIQAAKLLDGTPLAMERRGTSTLITIPEDKRDPFDTVIELR
ncbi:MAG TPA: alpha-L-fucosidase [Aggregatilineaceae bacterium]|nr:alpha-L-fucosidase [Aggregatilineaceae bacterium]